MDIDKKSTPISRFLRSKASREYIQKKLAKITLPDYTTFSIFAVIIGALAGLASVFFHNSIEYFKRIFLNKLPKDYSFLVLLLL